MLRLNGLLSLCLVLAFATPALAERPGWEVFQTPHSYADMIERLDAAVKGNKMGW